MVGAVFKLMPKRYVVDWVCAGPEQPAPWRMTVAGRMMCGWGWKRSCLLLVLCLLLLPVLQCNQGVSQVLHCLQCPLVGSYRYQAIAGHCNFIQVIVVLIARRVSVCCCCCGCKQWHCVSLWIHCLAFWFCSILVECLIYVSGFDGFWRMVLFWRFCQMAVHHHQFGSKW